MSVPFRMTYSVKWKEYAGAPQATKKSRWLGRLMCVPMLAVYGIIWVRVLQNAIPRSAPNILSLVILLSLIPFYWGLHKLRLHIEGRIAESAQRERVQR